MHSSNEIFYVIQVLATPYMKQGTQIPQQQVAKTITHSLLIPYYMFMHCRLA